MAVRDSKRVYRTIFDILWETPRAPVREIASVVGERAAEEGLREALEQQIIVGPDLARRSYDNLKEYVSLVKCDDPESQYLEYRKDERVIYHALTMGFCDLWLIAKEKIDIEGDIILGGYRSDYYTSFPPDHSWETTMEIAKKRFQIFDHCAYIKKDYIKTHLGETIPWDVTYGTLYRDLRDNLRKPITPIMKEHKITKETIYQFLEDLPRACTIATHFYPETLSAYEPYLFMFETDYEDFIIDLFSQFPTSVRFFKVCNKLFVYAHVLKPFIRQGSQDTFEGLYIPFILLELERRGIVKKRARASVDYYWLKRI